MPLLVEFSGLSLSHRGTAEPLEDARGSPEDSARLVKHIVENDMLNGEVIRLDGAIRLAMK